MDSTDITPNGFQFSPPSANVGPLSSSSIIVFALPQQSWISTVVLTESKWIPGSSCSCSTQYSREPCITTMPALSLSQLPGTCIKILFTLYLISSNIEFLFIYKGSWIRSSVSWSLHSSKEEAALVSRSGLWKGLRQDEPLEGPSPLACRRTSF